MPRPWPDRPRVKLQLFAATPGPVHAHMGGGSVHAMLHVAHAHAHGIVYAMWHVAHAHAFVLVCVCENHAFRLSCERVRVHTCMRARVCVHVCAHVHARARVYVCVLCVCNSVKCVRVTACVRACATVCVSLRADVRASLCQRVSSSSCRRSFAVGAIEGVDQRNDVPPGNSATDESGSRRTAAHAPRIDVSQLTRTAPPHLASAGENSLAPNTRTHARKAGWGGREPGADGSMGRTGGWGGREAGAKGSMGRKGAWGGREYGALGTPRHTTLHLHPQATTFLSPPGGIYLIKLDGGAVQHEIR